MTDIYKIPNNYASEALVDKDEYIKIKQGKTVGE